MIPEKLSVEPNYEHRLFSLEGKQNHLQIVVAPKDKLEGNALPINQQAYIYRTNLDADVLIDLKLKSQQNRVYIFVINGEIEVNNITLEKRDALAITETHVVEIKANRNSELVIVEVPMH
ncbi:hypothetical protein [Lacinutrix sp.]|uniref:pirin family protein n=1 Tax=Lacinutrix sp. TaxID=1937692 RepID=UPI0030EE6577